MPVLKSNYEKANDIIKTNDKLVSRFKSGAHWFYWIAAFSIINSIILQFKGGWSFIVGLGITQMIDGIALGLNSKSNFIPIFINVLISGFFAVFGYFAVKKMKWAFILGMVLYFLDGLIFLLVKDILSIAFHLFALFCIFNGLKALVKIEKENRQDKFSSPAVETK